MRLNFKTIIVVCVALLFMPWISIAKAEDNLRYQEIDFDISNELSNNNNVNNINIFDGEPLKEKETWPEMVANANGIYWGNLFPAASVIASNIPSHTLWARTVIQIPETDIATGSSGFWIRVPMDGTKVSSFSLKIDGEINQVLTYENPYDLYAWTFWNDGDTDTVIWDERGIFIYLYYALSTQYKYELTPAGNASGGASLYQGHKDYFVLEILDAIPMDGEQIVMLMTEEDYEISSEFYIIASTIEGEEFGFEINPGVFLAWAFIFVQGLPSTGCFSFNFPALERTVAYSADNSIIIKKTLTLNDSYITVHLPYKGSMSWNATVLLGGATFYGAATTQWQGTITSKTDMLSFSPAWNVSTFATETDVDITVTLIPISGEITLFSAFDRKISENFGASSTEESYVIDLRYITEDVIRVPPRFSSVWANIYETDGVVTLLTWDGEKTHLDFGWGSGYKWPGEMEIWIKMDDQTEIYWRGNVEQIYGGIISKDIDKYSQEEMNDLYLLLEEKDLLPTQNDTGGASNLSEMGLLDAIIYAVKETGHRLWEGIKGIISTLWNYIAKALEVIGNFIINLVGKIIAFLKNVVEFVGIILNSCIWILPPSLILFGLAHASNFSEARGTSERIKEKRVAKIVSKQRAKEEAYREKAKKARSIGEERYKRLKKREAEDYDKYLKQKQREGKIKI